MTFMEWLCALSWFELVVVGVTGGLLVLVLLLVLAHVLRSFWRWHQLASACGGDDAALRVLFAMRAARDARADRLIARGVKAAVALRLVKS